MNTRIGQATSTLASVITVMGAVALASRELLGDRQKPVRRNYTLPRLACAAIGLAGVWTAASALLPLIWTATGAGVHAPTFSRARRSIVGQPLPAIVARALSGDDVRLPEDVSGKVVLLAMGFGYSSRTDVEAWFNAFRDRFQGLTGLGAYQVAMLGGVARFAASIIETGMRSATRDELHNSVLTVHEPVERIRRSLGATDDSDTWIYLLGRRGRVLFQCSGRWDEMLFRQMAMTAEAAMAADVHV